MSDPERLQAVLALDGLTVLLVEDEALIAWEEEALLKEAGAAVIGPAMRVADALAAVGGHRLDAALIDITLADGTVFGAADALAEADVPFVFVTGHSPDILPDRHRHRPVLTKPFEAAALIEMLAQAIRGGPIKGR